MRRAFTVLEVLIAMAIICILSALMMPVFVQAKEKAKETVCMNNLKQLGMALELYHNDNGEYPTPWDPYQTYMSGAKLKCPADKGPGDNFASYLNLANTRKFLDGEQFPDRFDRFMECREKRGTDFPLIFDQNHLPKMLRDDDVLPGFGLIYRASGAVQRVSKRKVAQVFDSAFRFTSNPGTPCDVRLMFANL